MKKIFSLLIVAFILFVIAYLLVKEFSVPKYRGDLHLHTTCSDGKGTYEEVVKESIKMKLNFIAITDHKVCSETLAKCKAETKILCLPGQEVTTKRIHVLAINIASYINPNKSLIEIVNEIHRQGGMAIAAHPDAKEFLYTDSELKDSDFDAQECTGNYGERRYLPCIFDSDAHELNDIAWQFNSCIGVVNNFDTLKNLIISGKCSRGVSLNSFTPNSSNNLSL